jgi:hypothetical protein
MEDIKDAKIHYWAFSYAYLVGTLLAQGSEIKEAKYKLISFRVNGVEKRNEYTTDVSFGLSEQTCAVVLYKKNTGQDRFNFKGATPYGNGTVYLGGFLNDNEVGMGTLLITHDGSGDGFTLELRVYKNQKVVYELTLHT